MNEGFRNLALLVWALCAVNSNSYAQDSATVITEESSTSAPTIVYGAARRADGETDEVLIEQPAGAPNPLGNPLPDAAEQQQPQAVTDPVSGGNADNAPAAGEPMQDVPNVQGQPVVSAPKLGQEFQNTLMEADGMVYDVQAYPTEDLKAIGNSSNPETIYSPNVNP